MKKMTKIGILLIAMVLTTNFAYSQSGTGDGTADILSALTIVHVGANPLDFGDIIPSTGGTVKILNTQAGTRSLESGACELVGNEGGSAKFNITGHPSTDVDLTVDANVTLTENVGAIETMAATLTLSGSTLSLDGSGLGSIYVGGTLTVAENQAVGTYEGTFDVTVSYQ